MYFEGKEGEKPVEKDIPEQFKSQAQEYRLKMIEALSDFDDGLAEKFLNEEEPAQEELYSSARKACLSLNATPVFMGSAFKNKGVQLVLSAVLKYLPGPDEVENKALDQEQSEKEVILSPKKEKPFVGLAFKLDDTRFGQLTYMRLYQGKVKKGDFIYNIRTGKKVKVPRIVYMHADEMEDIESASGGDIVAFFGIDCASGDTFCSEDAQYTMTSMFVPNAVISMAVEPKERSATGNFSKALQKFSREDPTFRVHRDEESAQTVISGMGELHLNIYIERMKREFNCEVNVGQPQVAYRETITKPVEYEYTHKKQTGGAGQFAKVVGTFNPLPVEEEKNYEFVSKITGGRIPKEYIPAVDRGFQEQMRKGPLIGFPIVGVQAILSDGAFHDVDSSELAFKICAMAAFREHFSKAGPAILEPIMKLEVSAPDEFQGNVIGQINQRRGMIKNTHSQNKFVTIEAEVPLAEMFNYSTELRSATQGKGEFTMEFFKYSQAPGGIQAELIKQKSEKNRKEKKA